MCSSKGKRGRPPTIDLDDNHNSENLKGSDSKGDIRLERRWKRRELSVSNKRLKLNHYDIDGTRSAVKSCGKVEILTVNNDHQSEDEMDEDYRLFLETYEPDDIGYNSDHNDSSDCHYRTFLKGYRKEKERHKTGNQGVDSIGKKKVGPMKSQQNLEAKRGLKRRRPREHVSGVTNSNCHSNMELDVVDEDYQIYLNSCSIEDDCYTPREIIGKRSSVMRNSPIVDHAFDTPEVLCEVDEDYETFLNSARIVNGELEECTPERNTSNTDNVDGDSNSSDSDLVLIDPNQIHENTPFVSSKKYDASWFETEINGGDNHDNSQFRTRLMNDLQRPYDKEECNRLMLEVRQKRQKERHVETRQGVVKDYHTKGVNKSYLELYPDLEIAISKFKKPDRVLFLLRGFAFWLQVSQ